MNRLTDYAQARSNADFFNDWFMNMGGCEEWRFARQMMGYTLRELGEELGVHHTYLWRIEAGECTPNTHTLVQYADLVSRWERKWQEDLDNARQNAEVPF